MYFDFMRIFVGITCLISKSN